MQYILSLSYGKDSLACLEAIRLLGWPLDRIIHAEVWATDTIPADLPPMVEFKAKADAIIKERYGIEVEHVRAMQNSKTHGLQRLTFETMFYDMPKKRDVSKQGMIKGFPGVVQVRWCRKLKVNYFQKVSANENTVQYLGIAANEQERIKRISAGCCLESNPSQRNLHLFWWLQCPTQIPKRFFRRHRCH